MKEETAKIDILTISRNVDKKVHVEQGVDLH